MKQTSILCLACTAAVIFVLMHFSSIWPLVGHDFGTPKNHYIEMARKVLDEQHIDHTGYTASVRLKVQVDVVDTIQREQSVEKALQYTNEPLGLVCSKINFKKKGESRTLSVILHQDGTTIGFGQWDSFKKATRSYTPGGFKKTVSQLMKRHFDIEITDVEKENIDHMLHNDVMHYWLEVQRPFENSPSLEEVYTVMVAGSDISSVRRRVQLTQKALTKMRYQNEHRTNMSEAGSITVGVALLIGYILFLFQLQKGNLDLIPAFKVALACFGMMTAYALLDSHSRHSNWDPLLSSTSVWTSFIKSNATYIIGSLLLIWALLAAGSQAPNGGSRKTASFWKFVAFRWTLPEVGIASLRGTAIGFACGALVILLIKGFSWGLGGEVALQPRDASLRFLNHDWPALAIVLFFFPVALVEEAGYRLYATLWIRHLTKSKFLAAIIPAIVFGIFHTNFSFLPPSEPWWARAYMMTVVGMIWAWAFFRFDFLTVVLCHFMADLVIFSWPLLASEYPSSKLMAALGISLPLWPGLFWITTRLTSSRKIEAT